MPPRRWQIEARQVFADHLCASQEPVGLEAGTGAGKSYWLALLLRELANRKRRVPTVIVTSRTQLVHDLRWTLWALLDPGARGLDLGSKAARVAFRASEMVGRYDGQEQRPGLYTVTTYPSLRGCLNALPATAFLCADEAHWCAAPRWAEQVERIPWRMGMSATWFLNSKARRIRPFDRLLYTYSAAMAIEEGVIVPHRPVELLEEEAHEIRGDGGELDPEHALAGVVRLVVRSGGLAHVGCGIINAKNLTTGRWYAERLADPEWMAAQGSEPWRPLAVSGADAAKVRRSAIADLRGGALDAVITVDAWKEGIDVPEARWIGLCAEDKRRGLVQFVGRGVRALDPVRHATSIERHGPKTECLVFDPAMVLRAHGLTHDPMLGVAPPPKPRSVKAAAKVAVESALGALHVQGSTALAQWSAAVRLASERLRADMGKRRELAIAERALPATEKEVRRLRALAGLVRYIQPESHREAVRAAVEAEGLPCGVVDDLAYALARVGKARGAMRGAPFWRMAQVVVRVPEGVGLPGLG